MYKKRLNLAKKTLWMDKQGKKRESQVGQGCTLQLPIMHASAGATRGDILGLHSDGQGDSFSGRTLEKWLGGHPSAAG
jgi:hypothetical protein